MNYLHNLTYFDIYEKNARFKGSSTAIHFKTQDITYSDLFLQTAKLANGLKTLNLPAGSRIAVLCKNHPAFFHLFGAAAALNLVLVLINRRLSADEVSYIIEDTTPSLIISDAEMADQATTLTNTFSCLKKSYVVDSDDADFAALYDAPPLEMTEPCRSADPFVIIHTAAVQGKPRGAVLSQENIILANEQIIRAFGLDDTKSYLGILPLFHIMAINLGLGMLQAGGKNIIVDKFNPQTALDLIKEQKATLFGSFPPILTNLLDAMENGSHDLSSLEIVAGLEMPETAEKWESKTDSVFWTMYGQTDIRFDHIYRILCKSRISRCCFTACQYSDCR